MNWPTEPELPVLLSVVLVSVLGAPELVFTPANGGAELHIDLCYLAKQGPAVLELSALGRSLRVAPPQADRPWTPRLCAQRPKPKAAPKPEAAKAAGPKKAKAPKSDEDSSAPAIKPEPRL